MISFKNYRYSKQLFLQDVPNPIEMPDGTMSFMDFMGSRLNRYQNPDAASKNRVHPPSKTLYYWNAPVDWTEDSIKKVTRCTLSLTNAMCTRCNNNLLH